MSSHPRQPPGRTAEPPANATPPARARDEDVELELAYAHQRIDFLQDSLRLLAEGDMYGTDDPGYRQALDVQYRRSGFHVVDDHG